MSKKSKYGELYRDARHFLDLKQIFPKKVPKNSQMTDYQAKKIRAAMREFRAATANMGKDSDFIRLRPSKGLSEHNRILGIPEYIAGVHIKGGDEINKNVTVRGGILKYERGELLAPLAFFPISLKDREGVEPQLEKIAARIKKYAHAQLSAAGQAIKYGLRFNNNFAGVDDLIAEMLDEIFYLYDEYVSLFELGAQRPNYNGIKKRGRATNPASWNFGVRCHN